jgi:hypothetical protein
VPTNSREYSRAYWRRRKSEAIEALGGACVQCGNDDRRVLQIDHVDGDGHLDKCPGGKRYWYVVLKDIAAGLVARYQLLCANCHAIKTWTETVSDTLPH